MAEKRRPTSTSSFGVSRRESHDASAFYARFTLPTISTEDGINRVGDSVLDEIHHGDARRMTAVPDSSVALVVTSPPYFAGKEYELALGEGSVPSSYLEYLELLYEVFRECKRVLEPGGRIAVNVANLGRRPYRSLSADVIEILQNRLGLLLRGEIIWVKAKAASGSTAWGSYRSPANPVLRDLTERIIVASKDRFDRARSKSQRARDDLPSEVTMRKDDFAEYTTDVWEIPPESARRVNHPAPFPVELPYRLIQLYTYKGDVVLDPFAGSGSAAVAALRSERRFLGYELEEEYVHRARSRVEDERAKLAAQKVTKPVQIRRPSKDEAASFNPEQFQKRATEEGHRAKEIAERLLEASGFLITRRQYRLGNGVEVNFLAHDQHGDPWMFDVSGAFTSSRPGLQRTDTLWKALGKAAVIKATDQGIPLVLLTTDLPARGSAGYLALRATRGLTYHDALEMFSPEGQDRLWRYASGENRTKPIGDLLSGSD